MTDINTNYIYASVPTSSVASTVSSTVASASASALPDSSSSSNSTSTGAQSQTSGAAGAGAAAAGAGAGGAGAGAGAYGAPGGADPNETLLFHFITALLVLLAVLFLARLPRAVARFSRREGRRGFIFDIRSTAVDGASKGASRSYGGSGSGAGGTGGGDDDDRSMRTLSRTDSRVGSEEGSTIAMHGYTGYGNGYGYGGGYGASSTANLKAMSSATHQNAQSTQIQELKTISPPPHIPSYSALSVTSSIASLLSYAPYSSYSIGKLLLMAAYIAGLVAILAVQDGNPLSSPVRIGWAAVAQIPVTVALGTKNNVVGMLIGMGYERLNFFHRFVGVISFLCAAMHVIGYTYKWVIAGTFGDMLKESFVQCGIIAFSGLILLYLGSLSIIRNAFYKLFLFSHIIGLGFYLVAVCYHQAVATRYVLLAVIIYSIDHFFRLVKTRFTTARCTPIPELGMTRVELPRIKSGWRAGQHVRIRVLSGEVGGVIGWSVAHPFTIANASGNKQGEGLVLLVKKAGCWTNGLYDAADKKTDFFDSNSRAEFGAGAGAGISNSSRTFRVVLEGPYGGPSDTLFSSFTGLVLIGGGSGITFPLSVAEEIIQAARAGLSSVRFLELVWVTKSKNDVAPMLPAFARLVGNEGAGGVRGLFVKISVYYSRASGGESSEKDDSNGIRGGGGIDAKIAALEPNLTLTSGRPTLKSVISTVVDLAGQVSTSSASGAKGVAVAVCGPAGLGKDVKKAVRGIDGDKKRICGGVEVHEEIFGW